MRRALPRLQILQAVVLVVAISQHGDLRAQEHAQHATQQNADAGDTDDQTTMDHAAMDHAGTDHGAMTHDVQEQPEDKSADIGHATMEHSRTGQADAPNEPRTPIPPLTPADRAAAFQTLQHDMRHGDDIHYYVLLDRLEAWEGEDQRGQAWDAQAWIGGDIHRLWLRSEGERESGKTHSSDLEVLYGRSVTPWWDLLAGVRHDFKPGASRTFAAIGMQGLVPYRIEVEATAYIGTSGQTAVQVELEHDTLLTNRLILQWQAEADFHGENDAQRGIGSGLSTAGAGLRLRYEIDRQFAPYIGVQAERAFGGTADFRRADGEPIDDTRVVAGVRVWF